MVNLAEVLGLSLNLPSLLGWIASHYPPSLSDGKLLKEDNLLGEQKGLEEITKALFNLRLQDSWVFFGPSLATLLSLRAFALKVKKKKKKAR